MIFTRLWHIDLIPYLPDSQLKAQWRELNSIFKKKDKHILINYLYKYTKDYLYVYTMKVMEEMRIRKFKINKLDNFNKYFKDIDLFKGIPALLRFKEHDLDYLTICYYNLKEKYIRGQKDFDEKTWHRLDMYYKSRINLKGE